MTEEYVCDMCGVTATWVVDEEVYACFRCRTMWVVEQLVEFIIDNVVEARYRVEIRREMAQRFRRLK